MEKKLDMMNKKEKKGTISVDFLIAMILLILGFAVLVVFLFNIGGTGALDRTVCAQSVTFRATLPGIVQTAIPLKCQTNKICITSGLVGGNCDAFKGEKGINTVKVKSGVAGEEQIAQIYAREIYDCWDMMGQGKLSLFYDGVVNSVGYGTTYPSCVICTRLAFDMTNLNKANVNPDNANIQEYMMTHKVPNKDYTYFEFLGLESGKYSIDLNNNPANIDELTKAIEATSTLSDAAKKSAESLVNDFGSIGSNKEITATPITKKIDYNKDSTSVLFMQISAPGHGETTGKFIGGALSLLGLGFLYKPTAFLTVSPSTLAINAPRVINPTSGLIEGGSVVRTPSRLGISSGAKAAAGYVAVAVAVLYGVQQTNVYMQRSLTATKCNDLVGGSEARNGCSVVRAIPYEPEMISSYCSAIESIP